VLTAPSPPLRVLNRSKHTHTHNQGDELDKLSKESRELKEERATLICEAEEKDETIIRYAVETERGHFRRRQTRGRTVCLPCTGNVFLTTTPE